MAAEESTRIAISKRHALSEGLWWDCDSNSLIFVDIDGNHVYMYSPNDGAIRSFDVGEKVGTIVPYEGKQSSSIFAVVALESGIHLLKWDGSLEFLCDDEERDKTLTRFNDGKCDPRGRLIVGTMDRACQKPLGALYVLERGQGGDFRLRRLLSDVCISNGVCWSDDGTTMYYIDTGCGKVIWAFDYDLDTGNISNRREAVRFPEEDPITGEKFTGHADGCTMDNSGYIWTAHFGGAKVTCTDPKTGELKDIIRLPTDNVTSVAFGGEELKDLYISTAIKNNLEVDDDGKEGRIYVRKNTGQGKKSTYFRL